MQVSYERQSLPLREDSAGAGADDIGAEDPEYRKAKKRALNMLASRDHSSAELREKLLRREHPSEVVDRLVEKLQASKLLDDSAFAEAFVRSQRSSRGLSKSALRRELSKKGVPEEAVEPAVEAVDDEFGVAYEVALKKARTSANLPRETRMRRILGMLSRRGFPPGVSMAAAQRALDDV
ncbi:regulatory protein RecX [Brevibacterium daeguense]|nr:regulatory protein RecX [Brevibacterium daeguense]